MKLCMFTPMDRDLERGWPGRIEGDRVIQLAAQTLQSFFTGGGTAREHDEYALADVRLLPPVLLPPSVRDFYAFEQHVATARASRGLDVPAEWYEQPVFYFSNPAAIYGPEDEIPYPEGTNELDYELEVAAVIGVEGEIGGFTVMNDWSARDLQRSEMKVGLGPAKGKDFATSIGPVLVTPDEFDGSEAEMVARVNGEERSRGNLRELYFTWERIVAHAARNTRLLPGDVLGSGTVGTGCVLELGDGRWLQPGDVVELEVEGIGVLRNTVGPRVTQRTLVVDFDGTVTEKDMLDTVASRFGDERVYQEVEDGLHAGKLSLRDVITREFEPVTAPLEEIVGWILENVRVRAGFREFVEHARAHGWRVVILSSGFEELIRPVLEQVGVDVEVVANTVDPQPTGWRVHWREETTCATCHEQCKRAALPADGEVIYIGDGISDRCAALASDRVFATRGLARYLDEQGIEYTRFDDFHDVLHALDS